MYLNINSEDRTSISNSSTNFEVVLSKTIQDVCCCELSSITMPNTIYKIITGTNDEIHWTHGSSFSFTILPGAYSINNLISTIQTGMNLADSNGYTWSYDSTTFKLTISGITPFTLNFSNSKNHYRELGFTNTDTSINTIVTSPNVIDLYNSFSIYILVSELGVSGYTSSNNQWTFRIPMTTNSGGIITFDSQSFYPQVVSFPRQTFNKLNVRLIDSDSNPIDLNGSEW